MKQTDLFKTWYSIPNIKFQVSSFLLNREFMLLNKKAEDRPLFAVRSLRAHNMQGVDYLLRYYGFEKYLPNLYYSMAKYNDGVPFQNLSSRGETIKRWNEISYTKLESYDLLIDIDAQSNDEVAYSHESMIEVTDWLNDLNCPYYLRFSGQGFHAVVPGRSLPFSLDPYEENNVYQFHRELLDYIYKEKTELVDRSVADHRRVAKIPYSLAFYGDGTTRVCYPFNSLTELDHFKLDDAHPSNWLRKKQIHQRGQRMFNLNGDLNKLMDVVQDE